jgi:uncharacterized protein YndB with AHSA1/START domain
MMATRNRPEETLSITRVLAAPRELVWAAWTEPEHVKRWWGPQAYTSPACSIDLRVGGAYRFSMRGPDGREHWNCGEFLEIVRPERIAWVMRFCDADGTIVDPRSHGLGEDFPKEMRDVITFEALSPRSTRLTLRRQTPLVVSRKYGEDVGWGQSLDKFAALLRELI